MTQDSTSKVSVLDLAGKFRDTPLIVAGPGPGWDLVDWDSIPQSIPVFALNHAIIKLFSRPHVWWVSNDHDRTFQTSLKSLILPKLKRYKRWRTITQKLFIPGKLGDFDWIDHKGRPKTPHKWRLKTPPGSEIYYYVAGEYMRHHPEWIHNGHSVLEIALEVATIWGFEPIVCVGTDMVLTSTEEYYARPFRFKPTPRRVARDGLGKGRDSVVRNRRRWSRHIGIVTDLWPDAPFKKILPGELLGVLEYGKRNISEGEDPILGKKRA